MSSFEKARALGMLIGQSAANDNAAAPSKRETMFDRAKAWDMVMLTETVSRKAKS